MQNDFLIQLRASSVSKVHAGNRTNKTLLGTLELWEKYSGNALPPLVFYHSIFIQNTVLFILERQLATSAIH